MNILKQNVPLAVSKGKVKFELSDQGDANVSILITIKDVDTITHVEPDEGGRIRWVDLPSSKDYKCYLTIIAHKYGAQGPHYETTIKVNDTLVASATGRVPAQSPSDDADTSFVLKAR